MITEYIGYKQPFQARSNSPGYKLRTGEIARAKIDSFWPGKRPRAGSIGDIIPQSIESEVRSNHNRTNSQSQKSLFS